MPKIEDTELRQLFHSECAERLQKLDAGWLQLETEPSNAGLIEDMFREAHSLKGGARMLGLFDIQDLAHGMEDELALVRKGGKVIDTVFVQKQLKTIDRLRELVEIAVASSPSPSVMKPLMTSPIVQVVTDVAPTRIPETASDRTSPSSDMQPSAPNNAIRAAATQVADFHIDTLRVDANRLDYLLSQSGELVVYRNLIQRLEVELEVLLAKDWTSPSDVVQNLAKLSELAKRLLDDNENLNTVSLEIESGIRNLRLLPISTLFSLFPRMVHDLAIEQGKKIELRLVGGELVVDKRIIEEMKAPLMHLLRNAIDHGIETPAMRHEFGKPETSVLWVRASYDVDRINIEVRDDGQGLNLDAVRALAVKKGLYAAEEAAELDAAQLHMMILEQGFSTSKMITDVSGRGVGLNVVRNTIERLHGTLSIDSTPGKGMWINMKLPISIISTRVLLVKDAGQVFAIPFESVKRIQKVAKEAIQMVEGSPCLDDQGEIVFLSWLGSLLGCPGQSLNATQPYCVILNDTQTRVGVFVDELLDEQEVVIKPTPMPVGKAPQLLGVTILDAGLVCPVIDVRGLVHLVPNKAKTISTVSGISMKKTAKHILLAEDSITTRIQEKRILESAGYQVTACVDGLDAWQQMLRFKFDAVVSDIVMPNMSGLVLTQKIRANSAFANTPVILVTSLSTEEDRRRGLEAGADAYLSKPEFDQTILLECLERLI